MSLVSSLYHPSQFRQRPSLPGNGLSRLLRVLPPVAVCIGSAILPLQQAKAFDQVELEMDALVAPDWRAEQLRFTLAWDLPVTRYSLEIARLQLPALPYAFADVKIDCRRGAIETLRISCQEGKVSLPGPLLDDAGMALWFELDRASGRLVGKLQGIAVAGGSLDLDFQLDADAWRLQTRGDGLSTEFLATHWPQLQRHLAGWSLHGRMDLDAQLSGRGGELRSAVWKGRLSDLSLNDRDGLYVGEGIAIGVSGQLDPVSTGWRIKSVMTLNQGELLTPGFYLDAAAHPAELAGALELDKAFSTLVLRDVKLSQPGLLDLQLQAKLRLSGKQPLERLKLRVAPMPMRELYREMLQPVLAGTSWGRFEMAGEVDLAFALQDEVMSLELGLNEFNLDDAQTDGAKRRLGLYDVNGRLYWNRGEAPLTSRLTWQAGHLLEHIDIGPGRVEFQAASDGFTLTRQARIPLLDGTLVVDKLEVAALGKPEQKLQFDGFIEPISMASLSEALGWLPLSGKLSGMIPGLTYEKGLLSVDGILAAQIFDGDILIKQLQSRDLFGIYPQLSAQIELHNLDLESLTRTFSFGRITGRMDGYVRALRLEDWNPVAFDARFYTPEQDDSRHRISQRAVDNISNLGGAGLSGSLARSFMRFFKEFSYKRIGIGCRLQNGVCDMVGAGEAKQGYYLVEGSGLPRIDIIGYNTTADWSSLVEQLKQITAQGEPVVE